MADFRLRIMELENDAKRRGRSAWGIGQGAWNKANGVTLKTNKIIINFRVRRVENIGFC